MLHINHAQEPHVNKDSQTECCTLTMHHTECCHINCAWEPHVNQDLFISHTVSQRGSSKFHLKIPECESQHCLQSTLSQTHSYHGGEKTKQAKKQLPVGSLFLLSSCCVQATAGMLKAFPVHFVPITIQKHTV